MLSRVNLQPFLLQKKGIKRIWYAATLKNKQQPKFINEFTKKLARHLKQSEELAIYEYN